MSNFDATRGRFSVCDSKSWDFIKNHDIKDGVVYGWSKEHGIKEFKNTREAVTVCTHICFHEPMRCRLWCQSIGNITLDNLRPITRIIKIDNNVVKNFSESQKDQLCDMLHIHRSNVNKLEQIWLRIEFSFDDENERINTVTKFTDAHCHDYLTQSDWPLL